MAQRGFLQHLVFTTLNYHYFFLTKYKAHDIVVFGKFNI